MIKFFENGPGALAVMSEREDGSMKLSEGSSSSLKNRKIFFAKIGIAENRVIAAEIVHGTKVTLVDSSSPEFIPGADGLVTKGVNIFLSVTVADCIPVYLYEPEQKIIGILHCGWRGIVGGIIEKAMDTILDMDGKAENLKIALGPGINSCHFEIQEDVLDRFIGYSEFVIEREGKIFVDLKGIMKKQAEAFGVKLENIEDSDECTFESDRYFSYRRDKPETVESMVAIIGQSVAM